MMRRLARHFPNTIQLFAERIAYDDFNQEIKTLEPAEGFGPIPAYIEPNIATSGENRQPGYTMVNGSFVAALGGYYPAIDREMIARCEELDYNIVDVIHDPTRTFTMLGLERVTT
jgi:hypothetical protein